MIDVAWMADHLDELALRTLQHLYLAAISVAAGFAISFGLAIVAVRRRRSYGPILAFTGLLYTIPSLALFPFFIPITGLTDLTAVIPLVMYSLLIFVRNIVTGLDSVPADVLEAADGTGYDRTARFRAVEIPLALPLIVAGIRLAAVSTIGLVTITGILGDRFGGLGFFIFEGIRHVFPTEIFLGGIASIVLALAVDRALVAVERRRTPWTTAPASSGDGRATARAGMPW
jgi:osmoprotectant transport system permease protein